MTTEEDQIKAMNDLGLKVGTKEEALWTKVRDATEARLSELRDDITINEAMKKLAEEKVNAARIGPVAA